MRMKPSLSTFHSRVCMRHRQGADIAPMEAVACEKQDLFRWSPDLSVGPSSQGWPEIMAYSGNLRRRGAFGLWLRPSAPRKRPIQPLSTGARLACGRFVPPRRGYKNEKCPQLSYNHNRVEMRQFTTSVTRSMLMSIRFIPRNAYSSKPEVEEEVRRDVARDIVSKGYGDIAGHAEISQAGVHIGGTDPNEALHTTVRYYDASGNLLCPTVHVYHDETVLGPLLQK
ncbi:hypothetical protein GGX14DRAFT_547179 [Mycena pura]|uniref:Uncharacterized protein n=1 Tax=Mycena pura TaxID=153505 RepID=A0AAD6UMN5_9AGAR|nr:hypothetical protein GGX14DRAFT_547179 [Mycena pura]